MIDKRQLRIFVWGCLAFNIIVLFVDIAAKARPELLLFPIIGIALPIMVILCDPNNTNKEEEKKPKKKKKKKKKDKTNQQLGEVEC